MQTTKAMSKAKISISILLCGILVFWSSQVYGQEWTDEQKQVWKMVEIWWENAKQGDVEALLANYYVMESYEWGPSEAIPMDKKAALPKLKEWFNYDKPISYELEPLNIHIVGDVALIFYLNKWKGNIISDKARQIDTYVKHDNKWKFMGGMGCSCNNPPTCK
jgi:ketosteroid isomerase-like protein